MGNMSHCRFENTCGNLEECYGVLINEGGIAGVEKNCNQYDKKYVRRLVQLCVDIANDYGDYLDDDEDE